MSYGPQQGGNLYYDLTPTGIPGLDEALNGGFIRGRTYLVTGETGVGKTFTALSFIINGIMKYGEPAIYVSVDETYEQFINGTKRFGWDLEPLMQQGYFQILVPEMDLIETIRQKDPVTVAKSMVQAITDYANSVEAQRIVIDPIAPLVTLEKDVQVLREYIRTLVMGIERDVGATTIITTEVPTGSPSISRYGVEEFLAAGVLVLGITKANDGSIKRYLFIRKMRWQGVQPAIYEVDIQPKIGVVVKEKLNNIYLPYLSSYLTM
jgi:circadian clock protein KaiC